MNRKIPKPQYLSIRASVVSVTSCFILQVLPLFIQTASVFYGCIVQKEEGGFQSLVSAMTSYYSDKKPCAKELQEGGLYAVQEEEIFHRSDMRIKD